MSYSEIEARKIVLQACLDLVEKELVARTWGNVSARIDDGYLIITPSGKSYETLTEDDLVMVKIEDCSYDKALNPSSDVEIHCEAYKCRPDCNFIIHTHQNYATAISVDNAPNGFAPVIPYELPGKALNKNIIKAFNTLHNNVEFIVERHGVYCLGDDCNDAFLISATLENKARTYFEKNVSSKLEVPQEEYKKAYLEDYAQMFGLNPENPINEDETTMKRILNKNCLAVIFSHYKSNKGSMKQSNVKKLHTDYEKKYSKLK